MIGFFKNITIQELRAQIQKRNALKLSKINTILLWINYVFVASLITSICSKYISPEYFWILAFFGLAFPVILLTNILFVFYWLSQWRIQTLFSVLAILLSAKTCLGFFQIDTSSEITSNKDVKVMSYNSMLFDLYNWSKNKQSRNLILNFLSEENPDILCLQEFYTSEEINDYNNIDTITSLLKAKNNHTEYTITLRGNDHWGIATFTKYPIIKKGKIDFNTSANNMCIYSDVIINKDTVRIYNMHLQSIRFSKADYTFIDQIQNDSAETKEPIANTKNILRRLKRAFVKRASQADFINAHIVNCPYKIIVCGDFNDTPASYVYNAIRGDLKDAFIESGNGFEQTYTGKFPRFRIDYILHSKEFTSKNYHHLSKSFTDHYPIVTYLSF